MENGKKPLTWINLPKGKVASVTIKATLISGTKENTDFLTIVKNPNFEITPVRLLRGIAKDADAKTIEDRIDHAKGFGDPQKDLEGDLQNLETYLNTQDLNQALLQCNIGKVYDVIIDEEEWIADDLIVEDSCVFKGNLLDKFSQEFKKQHPKQAKKRGLILFLSPLRKKGTGGEGNLFDIDAKNYIVYLSNLWDKKTFAHETAHVLGLIHSFHQFSNKDINEDNDYVKEVDNYFNSLLKNNVPKSEIAEQWEEYKDSYSNSRGHLEVYYNYFKDKASFKQATTDNFMDYKTYSENDKVVRKNTLKANSFWKHQWKVMQLEVSKYYSK